MRIHTEDTDGGAAASPVNDARGDMMQVSHRELRSQGGSLILGYVGTSY